MNENLEDEKINLDALKDLIAIRPKLPIKS